MHRFLFQKAILRAYALPSCAIFSKSKTFAPNGFLTVSSIRYFSAPFQPDHDFMVTSNDTVEDISNIKVPYLRDSARQDIYAHYISNPEEWTVTKLSQKYKANKDRIKAVITLMHARYTMMRSKGYIVKLKNSSGGSPPSIIVEEPAEWTGLFAIYKEDSSQELSKVIADYNESQLDDSKKTKLTVDELKGIFKEMEDHYRRMENLQVHEEHMAEIMEAMAEEGVNTEFQENPSFTMRTSYFDQYYPQYLGDDDYETEKRRLLKRIEIETRARVEPTMPLFLEKVNEKKIIKEVSSTSENKSEKPVSSGQNKESRWKLAFIDLSKRKISAREREASAGIIADTIIRTRKGELRKATPLEEAQRSWNPRPNFLDIAFNTKLENNADKYFKPFQNFDGDDNLTGDIARAKLVMRTKLAAETKKK